MALSLPSLNKSTSKEETSATATASKSGSQTTTTSGFKATNSGSKGLPKLSSQSTGASSSSSSIATPTITPPSSDDNPFISRSSAPSGTVFIAVGAVAGFIFLSFILILFIKKLLAKRTAKKTLSLGDSESSSSYGGEKFSNVGGFYSTSSNLNQSAVKIPLLYENPNANKSMMSDLDDTFLKPEQNLYSTLDKDQTQLLQQPQGHNKRKSMFVSPTAEVMNYNMNKSNPKLFSGADGVGQYTIESNGVGGGAIPDLRQSRIESFDTNTDVQITNPERSPQRSPQRGRGHRTVPSQYLESMFEDN